MGTRFVPVPDLETAAALISEGLLWFRDSTGDMVWLGQRIRSATNRDMWCADMRMYGTLQED